MSLVARRARKREISVTEFKARCLDLIERTRSSGDELLITRHGKPVARLVPVAPEPEWQSSYGRWKGKVEILGNIVQCDWSEEFDALRGES